MIGCSSGNDSAVSSYENAEEAVTISSLDGIYAHPAAQNYPDIRDIPEDFSKDGAKQESCFVLGAMVFNEDLYYTFMQNYNEGISSFIRVVQATKEGDAVITDVLYDDSTDLVYVVNDTTRDAYGSEDERVIQYRIYENIGTWNAKHEYCLAYNGSLPSEDIQETDSENLWIITAIN